MLNVSMKGVMVIDIPTNKKFLKKFATAFEVKQNIDLFGVTYDVDSRDEDFPKGITHVVYMNHEICTKRDVYLQVLFHEFGHVFNQVNGFEDTEDAADDFAYDFAEENGIDLKIFHQWAADNADLYKED